MGIVKENTYASIYMPLLAYDIALKVYIYGDTRAENLDFHTPAMRFLRIMTVFQRNSVQGTFADFGVMSMGI